MRKAVLFACLTIFPLPVMAEILTCDALKARVDAKLQAKGVQTYTLELIPVESSPASAVAASGVPAAKTIKGKEVGTCNGGTMRLIYTKGN
jgi:hypothetical protein